jgi:hypothetical protein
MINNEILYYPNGKIRKIYYFDDYDRYHNENGPSLTTYYYNGKTEHVTYDIHNRLHNIYNPALIDYDYYGKIKNKGFSHVDFDRIFNVINKIKWFNYIKKI